MEVFSTLLKAENGCSCYREPPRILAVPSSSGFRRERRRCGGRKLDLHRFHARELRRFCRLVAVPEPGHRFAIIHRLLQQGKALQLNPDATTYAIRGTAHQKAKDYAKARDDYRTGLKLNPNELTALNNLAWMQATCPDDEFRDGAAAVELATRACQLTKFKVKDYVTTLAAAYAEVGDFKRATEQAEKVDAKRLPSYRAGTPMREE